MADFTKEMYKKYPELFMQMWLHSEEENPGFGDDISVIFSKVMSNVTHPDQYWMPEEADGFPKEAILKDFEKLVIPTEEETKEE